MTRSSFIHVAGAVCLVAAAVSIGWFFSVERYEKLLLALVVVVFAAVAVIAQFRNGSLGLAILIVLAVDFPYELGGSASRAPASIAFYLALAVCMVWLLQLVLRRGAPLGSARVLYGALAFMLATVVSFGLGQLFTMASAGASGGAQFVQLLLFLGSGALFLAVGCLIKGVDQLKRLTWLFLGAGALACATAVLGNFEVCWRLAGPVLAILDRTVVPQSIGSLFWVWFVALSAGQALFNDGLSARARFVLAALTMVALYRGFFLARSWVSGWLPPLVAVGMLLLFRWPRLTAVAAVIGVLLWLYVAPPTGISDLVSPTEEYSEMTRAEAARTLWPLIMKSPLVGLGPANYYQYTMLYPILGWYVRFNSHNQYLDLLAQIGFLGTLAFCWLMYEIAAVTWRSLRLFPGGFPRSYLMGALGGMAGSLVAGALADWIIPFYFNIGVRGFRSSVLCWIFLGGVLALRRAGVAQLLTQVSPARQAARTAAD